MKRFPEAVKHIQNGNIVAFPTETVYGLGVDAFNEAAVAKIFEVKQRPLNKSLSLHISDIDQLKPLVQKIPEKAQELINLHWPGALTILFRKSNIVPDIVTGGSEYVGIRMPNHKQCQNFIRETGTIIVGTSANISGEEALLNPAEIKKAFSKEQVPFVIKNNQTLSGESSTVVKVVGNRIEIIRQGSLLL